MERDSTEVRAATTLIAQRMSDPACVTWCSGLDVEQVARCFGADPESETPMTIMDAEIEHYDEAWQTVLVGSLDGWTVAIEPNGGEARSSDVIAALSVAGHGAQPLCERAGAGRARLRRTRAFHRRGTQVSCGRLALRHPPSAIRHPPSAIRDIVAPHIRGLSFPTTPDDRWRTSAFILAARLSDTHMTGQWLETEHSRFVISTEV